MQCPKCESKEVEPLKSKLVYGFKCKKCGFLFDPAAYKKKE